MSSSVRDMDAMPEYLQTHAPRLVDSDYTSSYCTRVGLCTSSSTTPGDLEKHDPPTIEVVVSSTVEAEETGFPEGGRQAYLCVFGSFCGCMMSLGVMNSFGALQAYLSHNQLDHVSEGAVGWIFGIFAFITFVGGMQIGPIFDAQGPRILIPVGSLLILLSILLLEVCSAYWHFLLAFSVVGGLGTSMVFTPSVTAVGHFFRAKRAQWTGFVCVGGSFGGVVYPLMLQKIFQEAGFKWGTRALALIILLLAVFANLFIRSRLPPKPISKDHIMPDLGILRHSAFAISTVGAFLIEWGILNPATYLPSYGLSVNMDERLSYQLVAILNGASCFERYFPGLLADRIGRFNAMILTNVICIASIFTLWLTAGSSEGLIIAFAIIFGFSSGTGISLLPVCIGQLCRTEHYGRYYATCYTFVSLAALSGIPLSGVLITAVGGNFWALIIFTGTAYVGSTAAFVTARAIATGPKVFIKF